MSEKTKLRVLVVDDYEDSVEMLSLLLQRWGYEVRTAFDGQAGLELMTKWWPDVALLDIGMPVMDGYEVARRIRQMTPPPGGGPQPYLVALTGYGNEEAVRRARDAGFDSHLLKPIDSTRLQKMLSSLPAAGSAV
jgi:CheY-like chemotaxis protein